MFAFPAMMKGFSTTNNIISKKYWILHSQQPGLRLYDDLVSAPTTYDLSDALYTSPGTDIAFDGSNMWITRNDFAITKVNGSGVPIEYTGLASNPNRIIYGGANMWTINADATVSKFNSSGVPQNFSFPGVGPTNMAYDGTNIWTTNTDGTIAKISPVGIPTYYSSIGAGVIAYDGTSMWVVNNGDVVKIASNGSMSPVATGLRTDTNSIAYDGTNMWISAGGFYYNGSGYAASSELYKIDSIGNVTTYGHGWIFSSIIFDGTNMIMSGTSHGDWNVIGIFEINLSGSIVSSTTGWQLWPGRKAYNGHVIPHWWGGS